MSNGPRPTAERARAGAAREAGARVRIGRGTGMRTLRVWMLAFVAFAVVSCTWAFTSPTGASPDEPAHIMKAASVVRGQLVGGATDSPPVKSVQVPAGIAYAAYAICYAHYPETTADCAPPYPDDPSAIVDATTSAGLYNPVYYVLVGWPSVVLDGKVALLGMRLVSALLCAISFATAIACLSRLRRPVLPVLVAIASVTPTLWFLAGSVNPNGLEATVALCFAAAYFVVLLGRSDQPSWAMVAVMASSGVLLVHIRGLSPLWLGLIVILGVVLVGWPRFLALLRSPRVLAAVAVVAVSTVLALVWASRTNSVASVGEFPGQGTTFVGGLVEMLERTVDYALGMVGSLGWLDTPAPSYTIYAFLVGAGVLLVAPLLAPGEKLPRAALALGLVFFLLVPPLVQAATVTQSGYVWQGRYVLPYFLALAVLAAIVADPLVLRASPPLARRLATIAVVLFPACTVIAELTFLRRNSVGFSASWLAMRGDTAWHPPGASTALWGLVVVGGGVLLVAATVLILRELRVSQALDDSATGAAVHGDATHGASGSASDRTGVDVARGASTE